jgi:hypothetical protein
MGKSVKKTTLIVAVVAVTSIYIVEPLKSPHKYPLQKTWSVEDSKGYAYDRLGVWRDQQMSCLNKLWGKESAWNPDAYNKIKVAGKNAGGIPQILGLDPSTPPTQQIDRGLEYIYHRYKTPCQAWAHFKKKGWH